ncbi:MAG: RsmD family RNA methyltransferase [Candidatus Saccharibacteria bacterium]|nr:RsmD family RNA methyltransferase [Candidatus Saccharibacteria bacterium]
MQVEKFIPGGQALATRDDGKKVFLWNAIPGETILDYQVNKQKSSYDEGIATKIANPSPHRAAIKDDCYLATSPWQILNYDYELKQKQALVVEIFREHNIPISTPDIITDNRDYFYRNKMEYSLYYSHEEQKIYPAFHHRGSHRKLPITKSSIEHPEIFQRALEIIDDLNRRGEDARKYNTILLRSNESGVVSGGLFEKNKPHPTFENLTDTILGREYSYSPNGFFQINPPVYESALREIATHIATDDVLDLYAGVGTIGLSVARGKNLTLVEVDKPAYQELRKNCIESSSKNPPCAVLAKSEEVTYYISDSQTVIVDPPRAGVEQKLINKLLEVVPPVIIYLSCNPATQARDVKLLLEKYQIKTIKTYNFFPHTPHIENLVILTRK